MIQLILIKALDKVTALFNRKDQDFGEWNRMKLVGVSISSFFHLINMFY